MASEAQIIATFEHVWVPNQDALWGGGKKEAKTWSTGNVTTGNVTYALKQGWIQVGARHVGIQEISQQNLKILEFFFLVTFLVYLLPLIDKVKKYKGLAELAV